MRIKNIVFTLVAIYLYPFISSCKNNADIPRVVKRQTLNSSSVIDEDEKDDWMRRTDDSMNLPDNLFQAVRRNTTTSKKPAGIPFAKFDPIIKKSKRFPWKPDWNGFVADAIDSWGETLLSITSSSLKTMEASTGNPSGVFLKGHTNSEDTTQLQNLRDDIESICPMFVTNNLTENQRKAFWTLVIAGIARYESGFDPSDRFKEKSMKGQPFSEGLLQLTYGNEKGRPGCNLNRASENILDPKINLECGVVIFEGRMKKLKRIFPRWQSGIYWAVTAAKVPRIQKYMRDASKKNFDFCWKPY